MSQHTTSQPPAPDNTSKQQHSDGTEAEDTKSDSILAKHAANEEVLEQIAKQLVKESLSQQDRLFDKFDVPSPEPRNQKTPAEAFEEFMADVEREKSQGTYDSLYSRLKFFVRWCEMETVDGTQRIEYLHQLDGGHIKEFRDWRRETAESWEVMTEKTQMRTLRQFLAYCEKPEWVPENLSKKVPVPKVSPEDESRDTILRQHDVEDILDYQKTFQYTSLEHCVWLVFGRTGCRISGLQALDLCDYIPDDETGKAVLQFRSREETGTRLKNGRRSERDFEVDEDVREILDDYIEHTRVNVTDDSGRKPLFTTSKGRPAASTLRKYVYMWSRPCAVTGDCPFNRDIAECEAAQDNCDASKCPDSVSPHPIRRGRLTWALNQGLLPEMISGMYDVSPEVLEKHYDERSYQEKQQMASMWEQLLTSHVVDAFRRVDGR